MHDQTSIRAADCDALDALLVGMGLGVMTAGQFLPAAVLGYAYRGAANIGGAALVGVHGLLWWTAPAADAGDVAARAAVVQALRAAGATYEGNDQLIYGAGTSGYAVPQGWEWIKRERDARKLSCGFKVGANWFHSDAGSRTQQLGLVIAAGQNLIPSGLQWKTMAGTFVQMTPTLAIQIFGAAMTSDAAHHAIAEQARAALEAGTLTDLSAIQWPASFKG